MHILKGMPICVLHFWSLEFACALFRCTAHQPGRESKLFRAKLLCARISQLKYVCIKLTSEGVRGGIHIISRSWMSIRRPREMTSITRPHDKRRRRRTSLLRSTLFRLMSHAKSDGVGGGGVRKVYLCSP